MKKVNPAETQEKQKIIEKVKNEISSVKRD